MFGVLVSRREVCVCVCVLSQLLLAPVSALDAISAGACASMP